MMKKRTCGLGHDCWMINMLKYIKIKSDRYWFKSLGSLILLRNLLNVWALSCETKKSERTLGVCHIISFTILAHFLISYEKFKA